MTKEDVLAAFERNIQKGDPRQGDLTIDVITKTAKTLITKDRSGVVEALRHWLNLRDIGLTATALHVIIDVYLPELEPDLEFLKVDIVNGKIFHPSYNYLVDLALKNISENPS